MSEKANKNVSHSPNASQEERLSTAKQYSDQHEARTGKEVDPETEATIGDQKAATCDSDQNSEVRQESKKQ
ncbi:hypothetical protein G9A89_006001 [Geosiphon pyriformis]|nr:hypothetical protein G9A89_006001 [Geosiphon pyriformis]